MGSEPRSRIWLDENAASSGYDTPEHRRSRLWLDYSAADSLRSSEYLENGRFSFPMRPSDQRAFTGTFGNTRNDREDDRGHLHEITAPCPIKSTQEERKQEPLEDISVNSSSQDDLDELDEVAAPAPAPIGYHRSEREQGYLEDRGGYSLSADKKLQKDDVSLRRQRPSRLATEIYTISYLVFFSIMGTLSRLGLQALTFYPGAPIQTGVLWANVGGSLIMGFLSEDRKLFQEEWGTTSSSKQAKEYDEEKGKTLQRSPSAAQRHAAVKKTLPLYIGLATGFCGSFTSFSSFMRDCFFALSNALHVPISHPSIAPISQTLNVHRNPGYSFMALFAVLIVTVGLSLGALQVGAHLALALDPYTPTIPFLFSRKIVDRSIVFIAFGCWLGALLMTIWPPDRPGGPVGNASWKQETWRSQALFALVFAPLGCLLRFYASMHLNGKIKSFPLGTFAVNVFGTMMEAVFVDLQRVPVGGMVGCQVLQGMSDGFCGCLTTVSTWVIELKGLKLRHAYVYGFMSVGVGLSLLVIITGSLQWTIGFSGILCVS